MPTNRSQHLRTVGLMVTVGLLLALAVQVGLTAAATGSSGASRSRPVSSGSGYGTRIHDSNGVPMTGSSSLLSQFANSLRIAGEPAWCCMPRTTSAATPARSAGAATGSRAAESGSAAATSRLRTGGGTGCGR